MFSRKGQGSLEYLLLIGGAVLVAAIVIALVISSGTGSGDVTKQRANCLNAKVQTGNSSTCVTLLATNQFVQGTTTFTNCRVESGTGTNAGSFECGTSVTSCATVVTVC
ncbi:MAG: class III signal peptide-containing protein [Candidatus Diapherotrites archaeon]|uniref:Class III signal peptide-containing protein n=1 Tax=Candidatus Iainarchaeum sp. TaxID=3101447 RepID=A0A8T4L501_9ARCH|nr:class III signal peptide-containing protein [Candidatus Diapherotrites archaeon]